MTEFLHDGTLWYPSYSTTCTPTIHIPLEYRVIERRGQEKASEARRRDVADISESAGNAITSSILCCLDLNNPFTPPTALILSFPHLPVSSSPHPS